MPSATTLATVRTFLRALHTGDRELLTSVALPHAELGRLLPDPATAGAATSTMTPSITAVDLPGERELLTVQCEGRQHLLVVHQTQFGPRLDLRLQIAAAQPDDARRTAARAFYRALLCGDLATLRQLAFDATGIEALGTADARPSLLEVEPAVQALALVELGLGEAFPVPNGVQFVSARHLELGIVVLAGLVPNGEIPFLLRQRDGRWRVITLHFLQSAAGPLRSANQGPPVVTSRR